MFIYILRPHITALHCWGNRGAEKEQKAIHGYYCILQIINVGKQVLGWSSFIPHQHLLHLHGTFDYLYSCTSTYACYYNYFCWQQWKLQRRVCNYFWASKSLKSELAHLEQWINLMLKLDYRTLPPAFIYLLSYKPFPDKVCTIGSPLECRHKVCHFKQHAGIVEPKEMWHYHSLMHIFAQIHLKVPNLAQM